MKKQFLNLCTLALTLLLIPKVHAAACSAEDPAPEPAFEFFDMLLRQFAREAFFEQLAVVRKEHPEIIDPRELINTVLSNVINDPKRADSDDATLVNNFGLSILDLVEHNLMPKIQYQRIRRPELDLSDMYIDDLCGIEDAPELMNVGILDLNNNKLRTIPSGSFKGLNNLGRINIKNNPLHTIAPGAFSGPRNLIWLDLRDNQLRILAHGAFDENLARLNLSNNQLQAITPGLFAGLNELGWLNLSNNAITPADQGRIDTEVRAASSADPMILF